MPWLSLPYGVSCCVLGNWLGAEQITWHKFIGYLEHVRLAHVLVGVEPSGSAPPVHVRFWAVDLKNKGVRALDLDVILIVRALNGATSWSFHYLDTPREGIKVYVKFVQWSPPLSSPQRKFRIRLSVSFAVCGNWTSDLIVNLWKSSDINTWK